MLRFLTFVLVGMVCMSYAPTSARAFSETKPADQAEAPPKPSFNSPSSELPPKYSELTLKDLEQASSPPKSSRWYFFSLPSIDKFKFWPKFDFGLEILHPDKGNEPVGTHEEDDLAVKGRLRHKF